MINTDKLNAYLKEGREYLNPDETAEIYGVKPGQMARRRCDGSGPHFSKVGNRIVYRLIDIKEHIDGNVMSSTTERSARKKGLLPTRRGKPSKGQGRGADA